MALNGLTQTWHGDMHAYTRACVCVCVCVYDTTKVIFTSRFVLKQLLVKFIYPFQHPLYVY